MSSLIIDTHQHFWNLNKVEYTWLTSDFGPIYRSFGPADLAPQLKTACIDRTVLVQSANNDADTISMLTQSEDYDWIGAVIGWVPLLNPARTRTLLQRYTRHLKFRGMRHLVHNEQDPDWVVQPKVTESLCVLAEFNQIFELVAVFPLHLEHAPTLAQRLPNLTIVIDHLAKPPIASKKMGEWARQMKAAAHYPNVLAKVSGLNTAADPANWSATDLKPYIDFAIDTFGPDRLMFGSDWPVLTLAGDYARVWEATNEVLSSYPAHIIDAILGGTAQRVYRIT